MPGSPWRKKDGGIPRSFKLFFWASSLKSILMGPLAESSHCVHGAAYSIIWEGLLFWKKWPFLSLKSTLMGPLAESSHCIHGASFSSSGSVAFLPPSDLPCGWSCPSGLQGFSSSSLQRQVWGQHIYIVSEPTEILKLVNASAVNY